MDAVAQQGYALLNIDMPVYGLRCSPLLGLDSRVDFAGPFLSELEDQVGVLSTSSEVTEWVEHRIGGYGKDARGLVRKGVAEWLNTEASMTDSGRQIVKETFSL